MKFPRREIKYSTSYSLVYLNGLGEFWVSGLAAFIVTLMGLQARFATKWQSQACWTNEVQTIAFLDCIVINSASHGKRRAKTGMHVPK